MKKVILAQTIVMTVLMGCSFSKDTDKFTHAMTVQTTERTSNSLQNIILFEPKSALVEALKNKNAQQINSHFADGSTPLENAANRGNEDIIRLLIKAGASPFIVNRTSGSSLFLESLKVISKEEAKNPTYNQTFNVKMLATAFIMKNVGELLKNRSYDTLLEYIIQMNIPASVVLTNYNSLHKLERLPAPALERLLNTPSFQNDLTIPIVVKKPYQLFAGELERQLDESTAHLALLEFLSKKMPSQLFGLQHYAEEEDRTYYFNPAFLMTWRNSRQSAKHQHLIEKIQELSHFPKDVVAVYCQGSCAPPSDTKSAVYLADLDLGESGKDQVFLTEVLEYLDADFWEPAATERDEE